MLLFSISCTLQILMIIPDKQHGVLNAVPSAGTAGGTFDISSLQSGMLCWDAAAAPGDAIVAACNPSAAASG